MGTLIILQTLQISCFAIAGAFAWLVHGRTRAKTNVWLIISISFFTHVLRSLIVSLEWSKAVSAQQPYGDALDIVSALIWMYIIFMFLTIPTRSES